MPRSDDNCRACGKLVGVTGESHKWRETVEDGRLVVFRLCLGCEAPATKTKAKQER